MRCASDRFKLYVMYTANENICASTALSREDFVGLIKGSTLQTRSLAGDIILLVARAWDPIILAFSTFKFFKFTWGHETRPPVPFGSAKKNRATLGFASSGVCCHQAATLKGVQQCTRRRARHIANNGTLWPLSKIREVPDLFPKYFFWGQFGQDANDLHRIRTHVF